MAANSRLASAAQILCVMAHIGESTTSGAIANSLQTNPVVVLRMLKLLERAGLVELRPGRDGGVGLAKPPDEITLGQVYAAIEVGGGAFAFRDSGNPRCPVNRTLPQLLRPVFDAADHAVADVLGKTTIGELARAILTRASRNKMDAS